jgi:hypothetical protein
MAKTISKWAGLILILAGVLGFVAPTLLGAHLSPVHNVIHLVSGALAFWFGTKGTLENAATFAMVFGGVYLLLGIMGFVAGSRGLLEYDANLWRVIPGVLELGRREPRVLELEIER